MSIDAVTAAQEPVVAAQVQDSKTDDSSPSSVSVPVIAPDTLATETSAAPTVEAASCSRSKSAKPRSGLAFPKFNIFKKSVPVTTVVGMEETNVADVPAAADAAQTAEPELKTEAEVEEKKEDASVKKKEDETSKDNEVKLAEGKDISNVENEPAVVADSKADEVVAAANSSGDKATKFNPVKMFRSWSKKGREEAVASGAVPTLPLKEEEKMEKENKEEKEKEEEEKKDEEDIKTEVVAATSEDKSEKDTLKAFFKFHLFKKNEDTASATPIKEGKESNKNAKSELPSSENEKTEAAIETAATEGAPSEAVATQDAATEGAPSEAAATQDAAAEGAPTEASAATSLMEIGEGEMAEESGESAKPDTQASTSVKAERRRTLTFPKFQLFKKSPASESVDKDDGTAAAAVQIPEEAEEITVPTLMSTTAEKAVAVDVAAEPFKTAEAVEADVTVSTTAAEGKEEPKAEEPKTVAADEEQSKAGDAAAPSGHTSPATSPKPDRRIVFPKFTLFKKSEPAVSHAPQSIPSEDDEEGKAVDVDAGADNVAGEQTPIAIAEASHSVKHDAATEANIEKIVEVPKKFGLNIFKTLSRKKNEKKEDAAAAEEEVETAFAENVEEDKGSKYVKVEAVVAIESIIAEVKTEDAAVTAPAAEEQTK